MYEISIKNIEDFLKERSIAMIGVSRKAESYTGRLLFELQKRNYSVFPVNPFSDSISGLKSYPSITYIHPVPGAAMIFTSKRPLEEIIRECAEAGIHHIWVYNGKSSVELSEEALRISGEHKLNLITGYCPYMFLQDAGFIHKFHSYILKLTGSYPVNK